MNNGLGQGASAIAAPDLVDRLRIAANSAEPLALLGDAAEVDAAGREALMLVRRIAEHYQRLIDLRVNDIAHLGVARPAPAPEPVMKPAEDQIGFLIDLLRRAEGEKHPDRWLGQLRVRGAKGDRVLGPDILAALDRVRSLSEAAGQRSAAETKTEAETSSARAERRLASALRSQKLAEARAARAERRLDLLQGSLSWRITAPLRKLKALFVA